MVMMSCSEVTSRLDDYLDDTLPIGSRMAVWVHLNMCPHCCSYIAQLRATAKSLSRVPKAQTSDAFRAKLLESFRKGPQKNE